MKLARIEHYRCGEPVGWKNGTGYSYVWVTDALNEDDLESLCEQARNKYLDNEEAFKKAAPAQAPGYSVSVWEQYPDTMTVAEIKAAQKAKQDAFKAYEEMRKNARKSFAVILVEISNGAVKSFWNEPPALKYTLDWGHSHGVTIDHGATKLGDYPFAPTEEDEDYV